jgi:hypothetical protein
MRFTNPFRTHICFDGGEPTGGADPNGAGGAPPAAGTPPENEGGDKTFTQAELDEIINKRLGRERTKLRSEIEAEQAEKARQAQMTEVEKLKSAKDQAEANAQTATKAANARIVKAEAKVLAAQLGVDPKFVGDVIALSGIKGDELGEDGEPDKTALTASINAVLKDRPFYKAGSGNVTAAGRDIGGGNTQTIDEQMAGALAKGDLVTYLALQNKKFNIGQ